MTWHWTAAGAFMLLGAGAYGVLVGRVWRRRRASAGSRLVLVLLATLIWTLAYAFELAATQLPQKQFWGDLKYLGICLLPPAWFTFAASFPGRADWARLRVLLLLAIEPVTVLLLLANRGTHDLIRFYPAPARADPASAVASSGPLFWPHLVYTDVVLWGSLGMLVVALLRTSRVYWKASAVLIGTLLVPLACNILFNLHAGWFGRVDLTPFGFLAACIVLVWGLFLFRLLDVAPIARSLVFETITDAVLVLDPYGRVVNLNPAAEHAIGVRAADAVGHPVQQLLPDAPAWPPAPAPTPTPATDEFVLPGDGRPRHLERTVTQILDRRRRWIGWLVVLRDVTERRRNLQWLRRMDEQRRFLLKRIVTAQEEERRQVAGDIHDDSIQAMAAVALQLKVLRLQLDEPRYADRIERLESAVSTSMRRLRQLIFELRPPVLDAVGLGAALQQYAGHVAELGGFVVEVDDQLGAEVPEEMRVIAYRIAQEALANVRNHAAARKVRIALCESEGGLQVVVADDGVGFDPDAAGAQPRPGHLGMTSMRERAAMAGGRWQVRSAPGHGTTVELWLPLKD